MPTSCAATEMAYTPWVLGSCLVMRGLLSWGAGELLAPVCLLCYKKSIPAATVCGWYGQLKKAVGNNRNQMAV